MKMKMKMKMKMLSSTIATFAMVCALVAIAGPASAARPGGVESVDCGGIDSMVGATESAVNALVALKSLCVETHGATSLKTIDRESLKGKTYEAALKVQEKKKDDAIGKLDNYDIKLGQLSGAAKPKITEDDATHLAEFSWAARNALNAIVFVY